MACALPVIATRVGGNPELVDDGRTGTLVPAADPAAMAAAMAAAITDPERRRAQGAAGLDKVGRSFRWERCVEQYLGVYDAVLAARTPRG
jgi:glycosyltransferase involved in cell wall biosynthesis